MMTSMQLDMPEVVTPPPRRSLGAGHTLAGSFEEVECEQDAHAVIHIRALRGRVPSATALPRLRLGVFTFCPFRAGWYQFI